MPNYRQSSRLAFLGLTLMLLTGVTQASTVIRSGHAGHWFAPERSGEGWVLELLEADSALLYWFTYDELGKQRWLTAVGAVVPDGGDGQRIDFAQLVVTRGARFGAAFDPADVVREAVGSASLRFDGCDHAEFSYSAFGQSQTFQVQRLARVMGSRCETPHGVTGRQVAHYAGQSGSWFDPTHNGEGYALHWAEPKLAIVTWYSYDSQGNQYWMLGTGELDGQGRLNVSDVHSTRGARFGAAFDPDDVERFAWGTITFELGCAGGSAHYESVLPPFGSGDFDLTRLTSLREVACPWRRPTLTELYDFELAEVPIEPGAMPFNPNIVEARSVTNDGAVFALRMLPIGYTPLRFTNPNGWEEIGDIVVPSAFQVSGDGSLIASSEVDLQPGAFGIGGPPSIWSAGTGWERLGGIIAQYSNVTAASADFARIVGKGSRTLGSEQYVWIWSEATGELELPSTLSVPYGTPTGVSNDGAVVVGYGRRQLNGTGRAVGVRWLNGGEPEQLIDQFGAELGLPVQCSLDCTMVVGSDQVVPDQAHPYSRQAWYWTEAGGTRYLGQIDDAFLPLLTPYRIGGVTADASMIVGMYATSPETAEAYVWTEHTGMASLDSLADVIGQPWPVRSALNISPDGRRILLGGELPNWGGSGVIGRQAAVLTLRPKHW
jgi:hypothetical protein